MAKTKLDLSDYRRVFWSGQSVEISLDGSFSERQTYLGYIAEVGTNMAMIIGYMPGGPRLLRFCWHIDDRRCQDQNAVDGARKAGTDINTGICYWAMFRLSRNQEILDQVDARIRRLEDAVLHLDQRLEAVEKPAQVKRKRQDENLAEVTGS